MMSDDPMTVVIVMHDDYDGNDGAAHLITIVLWQSQVRLKPDHIQFSTILSDAVFWPKTFCHRASCFVLGIQYFHTDLIENM